MIQIIFVGECRLWISLVKKLFEVILRLQLSEIADWSVKNLFEDILRLPLSEIAYWLVNKLV